MQDKGFQPACLFQWLDLLADMTDEIEIEVLQHSSNHPRFGLSLLPRRFAVLRGRLRLLLVGGPERHVQRLRPELQLEPRGPAERLLSVVRVLRPSRLRIIRFI